MTASGLHASQALSVPATNQNETPESAWGACQDTGRVTAEEARASTHGLGGAEGTKWTWRTSSSCSPAYTSWSPALPDRPCGPPFLA